MSADRATRAREDTRDRDAEQTVAQSLRRARESIPASEARILLCHAAGLAHAALAAHPDRPIEPDARSSFVAWVERRRAGEPLAYIVGQREFYGRTFRVTPDVLIPRPETELLVELALDRLRTMSPPARVLDLGAGCGAIAITLALEAPSAQVSAVERSPAALALARENALRLGARVELVQCDWFAALAHRVFDLVVANPPYVAEGDPHLEAGDVRFEPRGALVGGPDGLDAIRRIVRDAPEHLASGGWLMIEHGFDQGAVCRQLLALAGFEEVRTHRDLAGHDRLAAGRRPVGGQ